MVSGYPTFTSIPRVDGLSTDTPGTGRHKNCSKFEKFPKIQGNMKRVRNLYLEKIAIKELPDNISCLEALQELNVSGCSNLEKFLEIQRNMGHLDHLSISGTTIKELPYPIAHLKGLISLRLENCKSLKSLPSSMCELKSIREFHLSGCSNIDIKGFWEVIEEMEHLRQLHLSVVATITEVLPSIFGRLKDLQILRLINCENLVTLPNSVGNLTRLRLLDVHNCSKLHKKKLPDSLRSLQFYLDTLDISCCNLMEGAIPNDLWCLSSLMHLDVSRNDIRRIPTGIIQLIKLVNLIMNHCPMLEEIPELPPSLRLLQTHGCPCLKALSRDLTTDSLWFSFLNSFKLKTQE